MELTETIDTLNKQLRETFGIDTVTGQAIWRIVFSEDQLEKRHGTYEDYTTSGIFIRRVTEVREVPKYRQWIHERYVLERLVIVPAVNLQELVATNVSYEPIFVYWDGDGNYLPPKWEVSKFVIDTIYAAQYSTHTLKKYVDDEDSQEKSIELKQKRINGIMEEFYGDESGLLGTTINCGSSIIVPRKVS